MHLSGADFRKLIPAAAVTAVLVASLLVPGTSLASSTNNCGVKGYGYHDHGKVCPNRPFPGQGQGLAKFGIPVLATTASTKTTKRATVTVNIGGTTTTTST